MKKFIYIILFLGVIYSGGKMLSSPKSILPAYVQRAATITPSPTPLSLPRQISIPSLDIHTAIEHVREDEKGNMDVPKDPWNVAWYEKGYVPGQKGNAVLAGHVDSPEGPAIFYLLKTLHQRDDIFITDEHGEQLHFKVTEAHTYPFDKVPMADVFGTQGKAKVILITCTGTFQKSAKNYSERLIVTAEQVI